MPANTEIIASVTPIIERWKDEEGPLLPILNGILRELGYVPREAIPVIADALNLTRADVYGVVSFYHDYRQEPPGRHVLKLCRAEACQALGGEAVAEKLQKLLGVRFGETSIDGSVTLEPVYCLGLCACGPSAMLDGEVIGRLDDDKVAEIAAEVRS
ncbi:formate dehydrogenase subunit gamma [Chelativorans composti]|jgi:NADH:ubiquinone oxidoreductase 24 kD subunit|uniref:Formate dehydrogenase subunit gamma n=1 Tax=Chelativorans composti TaxID=768533 RepID=A0ABW5DDY5_9HYPH